MNKLETKNFNKIVSSIESSLSVQEVMLKKQNEKLQLDYEKSIKESKIKDSRIKLLLEKKSQSSGDLSDKYSTILNAYIKEQKDSKKLGIQDQKRIDKLLIEQSKVLEAKSKEQEITKQLNRKQELNNPFNAFKQAYEDLKSARKDTGDTGVKEGMKTLGKGLKESAKQQFTFKNLTKGLLHGTGIALDLPALNILASSIDSDVKQRQDDNIEIQKTLDEMKSIGTESTTVETASTANKIEKENLEESKANLQEVIDLSNLENITKDMHQDLSDILIDIWNENSELNVKFKQFMYNQKDASDDAKPRANKDISGISALTDQEPTPPEEDDSSIFDGISDLFGGKKGGKTGGKTGIASKGRIASKLSKFSKFGKVAKIGGGAIAALTAGYSKYQDVKDEKDLSTSQKTTDIASTATGAGAGALAGAAIGQALIPVPVLGALIGGAVGGIAGSSIGSAIGDYASSLIGDKKSTGFVNSLADKGIVETKWMGDSQVLNWDAVKNLDPKQLKLMLKYDDWNKDTEQRLQELIDYKTKQEKSARVTSASSGVNNQVTSAPVKQENILTSAPNTSNQVLNAPAPVILESKPQQQAPVQLNAPAPAKEPSKESNKKIDSFKMEEVQIQKYMLDRGLL